VVGTKSFSTEENSNNVAVPMLTYNFHDLEGEEQEIEIVTCPHCNGVFGVDSAYLDQVDDVIHCPMCCIETVIAEKDPEPPKEKREISDIWCKCQESYTAYYVPDGVNAEISNHHWRCNNCHKVVQIG